MTRFIVLGVISTTLFAVMTAACVAQEWQRLSTDNYDAQFIDSAAIVVVGTYGRIIASIDGGLRWKQLNAQTQMDLRGVHFFDRDRGIVVGDSGLILTTSNGGQVWTRVSQPVVRQLNAVALSRGALVVVGDSGTILRSTDQGTTWNGSATSVSVALDDVDCLDGTCIAVGASGTVIRSIDGGVTWSTSDAVSNAYLSGVSIANASDAVAVGVGPVVLRTSDGGVTWQMSAEPGVATHFLSVHMFDRSNGIAVGAETRGRTAAQTTDGGSTWTNIGDGLPHHIRASLRGIAFHDREHGILVGDWSVISTTTDGGSAWDTISFAPLVFPELGNMRVEGIAFASADTMIAATDGVLRSTDGGVTWKYKRTMGGTLRDVVFTDREIGAAIGSLDGLEWTSDAGLTWTYRSIEDAGVFPFFNAMQFVNGSYGFLGAGSAFITALDPGTWSRWSRQDIPLTTFIPSISFPTRQYGFISTIFYPNASEFASSVLSTSDGGVTWTTRLHRAGRLEEINGVMFRDSVNGFAFGGVDVGVGRFSYPPVILRTTNGGLSWDSIALEGHGQIREIEFFNERLGYAVGFGALILRTTDGGTSWERELPWPRRTSDSLEIFESIELSPDGRTVFIGGDGLLIRKVFPERVTGIEEHDSEPPDNGLELVAVPNVVHRIEDKIILRGRGASDGTLTLHAIHGAELSRHHLRSVFSDGTIETSIDIADLPSGLYVATWASTRGVVSTLITIAR